MLVSWDEKRVPRAMRCSLGDESYIRYSTSRLAHVKDKKDALNSLKPAVSSSHLLKRMVRFEKKIQLLRGG